MIEVKLLDLETKREMPIAVPIENGPGALEPTLSSTLAGNPAPRRRKDSSTPDIVIPEVAIPARPVGSSGPVLPPPPPPPKRISPPRPPPTPSPPSPPSPPRIPPRQAEYKLNDQFYYDFPVIDPPWISPPPKKVKKVPAAKASKATDKTGKRVTAQAAKVNQRSKQPAQQVPPL